MFFLSNSPKQLSVILSSDKQVINLLDFSTINFTVENQGKLQQKFCRYLTPLEGLKGDIILITNEGGDVISYQGKYVKRAKPTRQDYLKISPGEPIKCSLLLSEDYPIESPGRYKIQFKGSSVNGLPDSNVLDLTIES
jgi:hypothetical protein